jgi:hypothetical protein
MQLPPHHEITALDRKLAVPMFVVALAFLVIAGALLPTLLYRDHSVASDPFSIDRGPQNGDWFQVQSEDESSEELIYLVPEIRHVLKVILLGLYAMLLFEAFAHWLSGGKQLTQHIWYLLIPFLRLSTRDHVSGQHAWVAGIGWTQSSLMLEKRLAKAFSVPMVAIALPVLPLILLQFFWSKHLDSNPTLKFATATSTALIWMAFVFEFSVMVSVSRRKWKYCKEHWINLLIVALPIFGFLRLAALGNLFRLQPVAKTASVLRLRGMAIRIWRAVLSLGIIEEPSGKRLSEKLQSSIN